MDRRDRNLSSPAESARETERASHSEPKVCLMSNGGQGLSCVKRRIRSFACLEEGSGCLMFEGGSGLFHVRSRVGSLSCQKEGCTDIHEAIVVMMRKGFFLLMAKTSFSLCQKDNSPAVKRSKWGMDQVGSAVQMAIVVFIF